jgi:hypothetical protein
MIKYRNVSCSLILFLLFILSFISPVFSQSAIPAAGGDASGTGGSVSYSVGQLFFKSHSGSDASVQEGVQQPFEISVLSALPEAKGINLSLRAYPNPTSAYLTLEVKDLDFQALNFQLYDIQGRLLHGGEISSTYTAIEMTKLDASMYFLKVIHKNREIQVFKIIKR